MLLEYYKTKFWFNFYSLQGKKTCKRTAWINTTKIYRRDWEAKLDIRIINKKKNIG